MYVINLDYDKNQIKTHYVHPYIQLTTYKQWDKRKIGNTLQTQPIKGDVLDWKSFEFIVARKANSHEILLELFYFIFSQKY